VPDLLDICEGRHGGNEESAAAHRRAAKSTSYWRARILEEIRAAGHQGLTAKEAAVAIGKQLNTISGRFAELFKAGLIYRHGRRDGAAVNYERIV
jgi:DNA-binding transcriptional ArsR family regulator